MPECGYKFFDNMLFVVCANFLARTALSARRFGFGLPLAVIVTGCGNYQSFDNGFARFAFEDGLTVVLAGSILNIDPFSRSMTEFVDCFFKNMIIVVLANFNAFALCREASLQSTLRNYD